MGDTQVKLFGAFSTIFRLPRKEMLIDAQSSDTDKVLWLGKMSNSNSAFFKEWLQPSEQACCNDYCTVLTVHLDWARAALAYMAIKLDSNIDFIKSPGTYPLEHFKYKLNISQMFTSRLLPLVIFKNCWYGINVAER